MFSIDQQSHSSNIYAVKSSETEIIDLKNQVSTKLSVEKWLTQLEKEIKVSLRHTLRKTIKIANAEVQDFNPIDFYRAAKDNNGQMIYLASQILHTSYLEHRVNVGNPKDMKLLEKRLTKAISLMASSNVIRRS